MAIFLKHRKYLTMRKETYASLGIPYASHKVKQCKLNSGIAFTLSSSEGHLYPLWSIIQHQCVIELIWIKKRVAMYLIKMQTRTLGKTDKIVN